MKFVTIFKQLRNIFLIKDVGQIPFFIGKKEGYSTEIIAFKNEPNYPLITKEVAGLPLTFLEHTGKLGHAEKSILSYLQKHAKEIDILQLYHFLPETFIYGILYKLLNPKGFLYVKLDHDLISIQKLGLLYPYHSKVKQALLWPLEKLFIKSTDLFSVESTKGVSQIAEKYKNIGEKLFYLPSGLDLDDIKKNYDYESISWEKKENIILSIMRVGTVQKNTELLLSAIERLDLKDWRVQIMGQINPDFQQYIDDWFNKNPKLREKVKFLGPIEQRPLVYEYLSKAKVFCLPSRWESFGIVLIEAILMSDYIVTTDVISATDIVPDTKIGTIVPIDDLSAMTTSLQSLINDSHLSVDKEHNIEHIRSNYDWVKITDTLIEKINQVKQHGQN